MSRSRPIGEMIDRYLDDVAQASDLDQLQEQLQESPQTADAFAEAVFLDTLLQTAFSEKSHAIDAVFGQVSADNASPTTAPSIDVDSLPPHPSLPTTHYPLPTNFVGGPVFSYMVAAVVLCVTLLGAWAYKISHVSPDRRETVHNEQNINQPAPLFVGRITGMKNCKWANNDTQTVVGASASLGREYALASGLLEITYTSGARVILEGPCTYRVDSSAGGFLDRGKLTANIRGQKPEARGRNSERYPLSTTHYPLFSIKTPTAVVTDLGTEFGVEVDENGDTTSHVFQGSVRVAMTDGAGSTSGAPATMSAGESVIVKRDEAGSVSFAHLTTSPKFVRRLFEPPKLLDLLDIVAGGDGTGRRRELGIDPTTGKQDAWLLSETRISDNKYRPTPWNIFIDGVFAPHIESRIKDPNVQLDSAGHIYKHFADHKLMDGQWISNNPNGKTVGSIWARAADIDRDDAALNTSCWIYNIREESRYMPEGRGLLGLHANSGITFDLDAMRKAFDDVRPSRFRATAGLADGPRKYEDSIGAADLWIFLDGRLVWKRMYLRNQDGPVKVEVEIGPDNGFLSIVSTQCKFGHVYDWLVLGDPALEMVPEKQKDQ